MTDLTLNRSTVLSDYLAAPDRLAQVVADLEDAALDRSLTADTWTIRQLVHRIVDGDTLWGVAVKAAIGNPDGVFTLQWYWDVPQTTWAERWRYADRDVQPALGLFNTLTQIVVQRAFRPRADLRTFAGGVTCAARPMRRGGLTWLSRRDGDVRGRRSLIQCCARCEARHTEN